MRPASTALLALATGAAAQNSSSSAAPPQGTSAAPFPNTFYPGYSVPYAAAGAKFNETSPPSYPSPWMSGAGDWAVAYARAQDFVGQLTLAEKVNLTTGTGWETERCVGQVGSIPRLGFRSLCMQDSPVGVRDTDYNSVFPAGGTVAASFDRNIWYQRGYDMGSEHRDKGSDVQLGPVVGPIGRAPEAGRNWEGFSPDPYLTGVAVSHSVKGIQSAGVMACTKHMIGNEQEHFRQVGEAVGFGYNITEAYSSNIDDTTMHELYLWPFADAVKAGTASVMCSYNQVNNSYACQNSYVLNNLLKGELGFQGFVMSDWQAQHAGVSSALAGMDMAMPGDTLFDTGYSYWATNMTIAVLNGTMPEWRLDDMATRIVAGWYYVGRDKTQVPINFDSWTTDTFGFEHFASSQGYTQINEHVNVRQEHGKDIRDMAARSTVLLKNVNNTLPLMPSEQFTGVFGSDAGNNLDGPNGCPDRGCDNGTLAMAWGSGTANFPYLVTPLTAIQNEVLTNGNGNIQGIPDDFVYDQIFALASQVSAAIVFVNSDSGEGYIDVDGNEGDRRNLTLWHEGDKLISNVTSACNNTIVVIHSTGPVLVDNFYQNPNVTAILWAGIPGEQSGNSIVDVLYGRVNPAARLPFTMGATRQDYGTDILYEPNNGMAAPQIDFEEGVFVDYRSFDKHNITPIYEFGYGLSYTTFEYSDLKVQAHRVAPYAAATGMTQPAPTLGQPGQASDYLFPQNITRIEFYQYPYLNSTDLKASSGDPDYGQQGWLPPDATSGDAQPIHPAGGAPGGNPLLFDVMYTVTATIKNTGSVIGDEVPQLYVSLGGPNDPKVLLRGFDRLYNINPGQAVTFGADITRRDLSNWDTNSQNWFISQYPKTVYVGSSSRMLPLSAPLPAAIYSGASNGTMGGMPTMYGNGSASSAMPSAYPTMAEHRRFAGYNKA